MSSTSLTGRARQAIVRVERRPLPPYLTREQVRQLIAACQSERDRYIPWSLRLLRYLSLLLHPIAFLVTVGGFIIHVYMGTVVVRGGFSSVIRGEVTEAWARTHHRLWFDRITGSASAKK